MKVNEFKFWLEGFMENICSCPNKEQWDKIYEKLQSLEESPVIFPQIPITPPQVAPYYDKGIWYTTKTSDKTELI